METMDETNLLLRAQIELPAGLKLKTKEFREGWNFVRTRNSRLLEKKILRLGWKFISIVDGWRCSGVGETPQAAIANALNHALRHVSSHCNAVKVRRIEWTQYPWFFLARVGVSQCRIQQGEILPVPDAALPPPIARRSRLLPSNSPAMFPDFAGSMPRLRELLVLSRSTPTLFQ